MQRQVRLGDILDDYCPRERRITNHAVVAMIGDAVKQTRCTTCEAEHEYRHARVPVSRRKTGATGTLLKEVLAGMPAPPPVSPPSSPPESETGMDQFPRDASSQTAAPQPGAPGAPADEPASDSTKPREEGPVHRRLIRATLPRPEGQPASRPLPDFTMRRPGVRQLGRDGRESHGARMFRDPGQPGGGRQRSSKGTARSGFPGGHGQPDHFERGRGHRRRSRRGRKPR